MALKAATTPLVITCTQGGADAFVQGSVLTGLTGRQAYNVRTLGLEITNQSVGNVDGQEISVTLTRRSKTAMPLTSDSDVLWKWSFCFELTTSGAFWFPKTQFHIFPADFEMPIVEETIYAQLDSTATTLTLSAIITLGVEIDSMSDIDRLNLIARSLT